MKNTLQIKNHFKAFLDSPNQALLKLLKSKNLQKQPLFFYPSQFISPEAGLCGKALSDIFLKKVNNKLSQTYLTQYTNSLYESLHGVIKLMRHHNFLNKDSVSKLVVIYDPKNAFQKLFNPKHLSPQKGLVRDVFFSSNKNEILKQLNSVNTFGYIGFLDENGQNIDFIEQCLFLSKEKKYYSCISEGYLKSWYEQSTSIIYKTQPNFFILGENLTDFSMPFGAFLIDRKLYHPLNKISSALLNSSCFSGNSLSTSYVIERIQNSIFNIDLSNKEIRDSERFYLYQKYINPQMGLIYQNAGIQPKIIKAQGAEITYSFKKKKKKSYDFQGCAGSSSRGHNPVDIPQLLDAFDRKKDYHQILEKKLGEISRYSYFFSAPSGTSAIDIAVILAYIASDSDGYMVTFNGNYSGKSLISINFSPFYSDKKIYHPLFPKVRIFDLSDDKIEDRLIDFLENHKIICFLFEIARGEDMTIVPDAILAIIDKYQKKIGFYLIIDEVLTGFFRSGKFLISQKYSLAPNAIAIGKGTSDMTFPIAGVLVDQKLYQTAHDRSPELVSELYAMFKNQLGAHILYNNLDYHLQNSTSKKIEVSSTRFLNELKRITLSSKLFSNVTNFGYLYCLQLKPRCAFVRLFGEINAEFIISKYLFEKTNITILNLRLIPPLNISNIVLNHTVKQLEKVLPNLGFRSLFFPAVSLFIKIYSKSFIILIKSKLKILISSKKTK